MARISRKTLTAWALCAVLAGLVLGCETGGLSKKFGDEDEGAAAGVPKGGLLSAKLTALENAMDDLPAEDRKFLDEDYAAYGLVDADPLHQRALVKLLAGRTPPVVVADSLYSRSSNAQWYQGKAALKWTATARKDDRRPDRAEVVVGWMHSQIINQFTTYVLEFDGTKWQVVDVKLLDEAEDELSR